MQRTGKAIILGASGLIGRELLNQLIRHVSYTEIIVLVRQALDINHPKLKQVIVDFDNFQEEQHFVQADAVFCCIGSTRKKTPDLAAYNKVDHDYPLFIARIASQHGVPQFHLVSALGANPDSGNFYLRMKGKTEEDLKKNEFTTIHIYQPSLLDGERKESRPLEKVAIHFMRALNPVLVGSLKNYRSIKVSVIAAAMINNSLINSKGIFTHTSENIKKLA
jgi:uncharacterized protein YbjT (DUF2867 family)